MTQNSFPVIETERLILRVPRIEDFEAWAAYMADEEAARYIGGLQSPSVSWRGLATMAGSWTLVGFAMFSVIEKSTRLWIGRVGPWRPYGWPGPEVGWGIIRSRWGAGFAYEAAVASMDFAVDQLEWDDIIHSIHPDNIASQKLAQRLGSTNRGPGKMPPPFENSPVDLWGQTAKQWKSRQAGR
ncbi:MAG: GNAT family N-acetyltransferase [Alphaproteobacteria bacterium]|nr:GNAT family N-acetyltransferase [Alphaproteobacteria bacterium]